MDLQFKLSGKNKVKTHKIYKDLTPETDMENILVADVMTRNAVTAKPDENLLDCAKKMVRKRVGCLVLVNGKKFSGFISQKDILWALIKKSKADLSKIKAKDLSPKKIITIKSNAKLDEAIKKMKKSKFDRLPVVESNELLGIVTIKDVLNFHPELYQELDEFAEVREEQEKLKRIKKLKNSARVLDGICEECGDRGVLYRVNGMLICGSCNSSI